MVEDQWPLVFEGEDDRVSASVSPEAASESMLWRASGASEVHTDCSDSGSARVIAGSTSK